MTMTQQEIYTANVEAIVAKIKRQFDLTFYFVDTTKKKNGIIYVFSNKDIFINELFEVIVKVLNKSSHNSSFAVVIDYETKRPCIRISVL